MTSPAEIPSDDPEIPSPELLEELAKLLDRAGLDVALFARPVRGAAKGLAALKHLQAENERLRKENQQLDKWKRFLVTPR